MGLGVAKLNSAPDDRNVLADLKVRIDEVNRADTIMADNANIPRDTEILPFLRFFWFIRQKKRCGK